MSNVLEGFSPPVRDWFQATFDKPTPAQAQGWPAIRRGEHTLILAPTGSGKTLAAFLWGIDQLLRELSSDDAARPNAQLRQAGVHSAPPSLSLSGSEHLSTPPADVPGHRATQRATPGIRLVYVSPLKALNNDIQRNLRQPLAGIHRVAHEQGLALPDIRVMVRSGDTPQRERQAIAQRPPEILITTPESLYLMLTSPKARNIFRTVGTMIVDEIHTLAGNKRGVHLAFSLERLQHLAYQPVQRIGLSATIQPLEEAARFLGGSEWQLERAGPGRQGNEDTGEFKHSQAEEATSGEASPTELARTLRPRPVTIVDTGYGKPMDLQVETVVEDFRSLPGDSIWPSIIPRVLDLIRQHRTTLIFANDRRRAERTADRLNEQLAAEAAGLDTGLIEDGVAKGIGFTAVGSGVHAGPIRVHHGSVSKEARLEMERQLKAGQLPALVGTSSLELGIDIGAVDLVIQLQSPKSVAQGLQRVGRSGHLVGQTSKGRVFPTHREDLMEAAAIAGGMLRGEVEALSTPRMPLDVLAQQVVAMVSVETWDVEALFNLVRCSYAYQELTPLAFQAVLEMLAGRYPSVAHGELRARLSWDRTNNRLAALPGSRMLALTNGGTIPDRGAFGAYLGDGKTKLGELDEEFVYETRIGDTFMLGSQVWRVLEISDDRLQVVQAPGAVPRMPFWRGDFPWRPFELGLRVGQFRQAVAERLAAAWAEMGSGELGETPGSSEELIGARGRSEELGGAQRSLVEGGQRGPNLRQLVDHWRKEVLYPSPNAEHPSPSPETGEPGAPIADHRSPVTDLQSPISNHPAVPATLHDLIRWLKQNHALDDHSAWQVVDYVAEQLDSAQAISSDRTVIAELFEDALGDPRLVLHSPFGGRVNGAWGLALASALREQTGVEVETQSNDDGVLIRFPASDASDLASLGPGSPVAIVTRMTPQEARERILRELPDSAVFGAHFRQNAARALLLPGLSRGKRTPFWLQRLRAKDLLQVVRRLPDFPIVAETYRDVLQDVLDLPHLEQVLSEIQAGDIRVITVESLTPSPVAQSLLWDFVSVYMYEWDAPKAERQLQTLAMQRDLLQDLLKDVALDELLRPEAVVEIRDRLQHTAPTSQARTAEELAVIIHDMGDLAASEIAQRAVVDAGDWIGRLAGQGRIISLAIPTSTAPQERWVAAELADEYIAAFSLPTTHSLLTPQSNDLPVYQSPVPPPSQPEAARRILARFLHHAGPVTEQDILRRYAFPVDWLRAELDHLVTARELAQGRITPQLSDPGLPDAVADREYVDHRALEQIHRRTLSILRREVQPVPYSAYADFLARWQHLHPSERLDGPGALTRILQQLRAAAIPGQVWERDVLALRLSRYDPTELMALCHQGELVWIASGESDPRRARVSFLFRGEGAAYLGPAPEDLSSLSEAGRAVYRFLQSEGAVFAADIRAALELASDTTEAALVELVLAGLVTNDSLETLRQLLQPGIAPGSQRAERQPLSSLESDLAERLAARRRQPGQKPSRAELRAARRRVRQRLESTPPLRRQGRWSLVHRFGVLGKALGSPEIAARQARQLMARHGVVTRESLAGEEGSWDWGAVYEQLRRMEARGEVRRGYFVLGLPGVQFALPEAVERLRAVRNAPDDEVLVVLNACDPANLYGPTLEDGPLTAATRPMAFSRIPSTWLVQQRGLPILLAEDTAGRLSTGQGVPENVIVDGLRALLGHLGRRERRVVVQTWNDTPVLESAGQPLLESTGFFRDYPNMTWERPVGE